MFKVGDRVRRLSRPHGAGMVVGQIYTVSQVCNDPGMIRVDALTQYWDTKYFELVKEEKPVSDNPCIQTEEVKVIKTKIVSGRLSAGDVRVFDVRPSKIKGHSFFDTLNCNGQGSVSAEDIRKLARQLDEIANVLETRGE